MFFKIAGFEFRYQTRNPVFWVAAILVSLTLASPEDVRIELADVTGRHATTVTAGRLTDGPHDFRIEASALPAGIYFCSITAGDDHVARKVVVMH